MTTVSEVINETIDHCSEYLEMVDDPSAFVAEVLAKRVLKLESEINDMRMIHSEMVRKYLQTLRGE